MGYALPSVAPGNSLSGPRAQPKWFLVALAARLSQRLTSGGKAEAVKLLPEGK
jgi:hypothetical protein